MTASDPSSDQLAALWERGVALDSAWIEFAKFFDRFAYRALRTYPANDPDVLAPDPRYNELQDWLPKTWEGRKEKLLVTTRNERFNLLDELYAGLLWAIGFRTLPNGSDEVVRIPRRHFLFVEGVAPPDVRIDWPRAELRDGNTCYFDIRVVKPPVVANEVAEAAPCKGHSEPIVEQPPSNDAPATAEIQPATGSGLLQAERRVEPAMAAPPAAAKGGRPNRRKEIRSKVEELWYGDVLFRAIPHRIDQAREIRARLKGESARYLDDMQGYQSSSIQRIIGEVANERGQSKQTE